MALIKNKTLKSAPQSGGEGWAAPHPAPCQRPRPRPRSPQNGGAGAGGGAERRGARWERGVRRSEAASGPEGSRRRGPSPFFFLFISFHLPLLMPVPMRAVSWEFSAVPRPLLWREPRCGSPKRVPEQQVGGSVTSIPALRARRLGISFRKFRCLSDAC